MRLVQCLVSCVRCSKPFFFSSSFKLVSTLADTSYSAIMCCGLAGGGEWRQIGGIGRYSGDTGGHVSWCRGGPGNTDEI